MSERQLPPHSHWPEILEPEISQERATPLPAWTVRQPSNRPWLHLVLFLVTVASTMYMGSLHYAAFATDFVQDAPSTSFLQGAWYSVTILAILGTHEMGHYFACRYYGVDASLPYFIPAPPFILTGTLGAVIRIRQRVPTKRMLFDIGAAGPIAGFVVAVPALALGLGLSRVVPLPDDFVGFTLGEPLLFQSVAWLIWGSAPEGYTLNLHPVGLAAWFGLLVTAINLFPIAQLDGGHISYATLGSRSTAVTLGTTAVIITLAIFVSLSWAFWALMMVVMLIAFGAKHPQTLDDHVPLDDTRRWIAFGTLVIFVLCFTPAPIEVMDLIGATD